MTKEKLDELRRRKYPPTKLEHLEEALAKYKSVHEPGVGKMGFYAPAEFWDELLRSARLALKAREWLVEHSDITGVALAGAEEAPHIKADRSALRALEALRKEFGLNG